MEKQRWEESERRRAEERRSEKRKSQKKEDAGARKGRKVAKHCVFPMICGSGGSKSRRSPKRCTRRIPKGDPFPFLMLSQLRGLEGLPMGDRQMLLVVCLLVGGSISTKLVSSVCRLQFPNIMVVWVTIVWGLVCRLFMWMQKQMREREANTSHMSVAIGYTGRSTRTAR